MDLGSLTPFHLWRETIFASLSNLMGLVSNYHVNRAHVPIEVAQLRRPTNAHNLPSERSDTTNRRRLGHGYRLAIRLVKACDTL
jgi:hypothetical protein